MFDEIVAQGCQQPGFENFSGISEEDVAAMLSILVFERDIDTTFIVDNLPDWLPPTEVEINILLPDWIDSNIENMDFDIKKP